ncbi:hypothetical protein AOLI_G00030200 [Acnodon oligacanthus]
MKEEVCGRLFRMVGGKWESRLVSGTARTAVRPRPVDGGAVKPGSSVTLNEAETELLLWSRVLVGCGRKADPDISAL